VSNLREGQAWQITKKIAVDPARRLFARASGRGRIPLTWCEGRNWGDALSPVIVNLLSGKQVVHREGLHHDRYLVLGSILGGANSRSEVWGSGFIRAGERVVEKPRAVHAVRGPLTRDMLVSQAVECPDVFGDPALLLPRFFRPDVEKRFEIGIVPHYADKSHGWIERVRRDSSVHVLNIESGIAEFVREALSCQVILSSSLHGLICADSYGIPSAWLKLSDQVVGRDFKFRDYRRSITADDPIAVEVTASTPLAAATRTATLTVPQIDLRKLVLACPFLRPELRSEIDTVRPESNGLPQSFRSVRLNEAHTSLQFA
jgi:pyruvyltransferase